MSSPDRAPGLKEAGTKKRPPGEPSPRGLRMRELEHLTGESRATILYWISQGILPPPVKTSRNMAWYDFRYPKLIDAIRTCQRDHNSSIADLRALVEQRGDPFILLELQENFRNFLLGFPGRRSLDRSEFLRVTGWTEGELDEALESDLVLPVEEGRFDENDVHAAFKIQELRREGWSLEDLTFYPREARHFADREMEVLRRNWPRTLSQDWDKRRREAIRETTLARQYIFSRIFLRAFRRWEAERQKETSEGAIPPEGGKRKGRRGEP
ncbi:MAG TPA: MerR family transcriptional regulator [Synergistaceae bacterium]|nr:MerR family transcriptional regulator [Synergistaceae bacterium]HQH79434.1 MerR family transcriptional regulator [Synergistaceae bacterium]HQK25873.1 MerR family transcriptional regulator [Synergistaceae bacterium]